jgi:hypothetical protein
LNKNIEEDRSEKKVDHRKLRKKKKMSTSVLEHHAGKKERQVGEAHKSWVKLT